MTNTSGADGRIIGKTEACVSWLWGGWVQKWGAKWTVGGWKPTNLTTTSSSLLSRSSNSCSSLQGREWKGKRQVKRDEERKEGSKEGRKEGRVRENLLPELRVCSFLNTYSTVTTSVSTLNQNLKLYTVNPYCFCCLVLFPESTTWASFRMTAVWTKFPGQTNQSKGSRGRADTKNIFYYRFAGDSDSPPQTHVLYWCAFCHDVAFLQTSQK